MSINKFVEFNVEQNTPLGKIIDNFTIIDKEDNYYLLQAQQYGKKIRLTFTNNNTINLKKPLQENNNEKRYI
ncbi:MAG: hypothetical protein J5896_02185 [Alphaproteobacteria bacterium]|nr:hypothetical protein [Alphaproteobacteria bacterium]